MPAFYEDGEDDLFRILPVTEKGSRSYWTNYTYTKSSDVEFGIAYIDGDSIPELVVFGLVGNYSYGRHGSFDLWGRSFDLWGQMTLHDPCALTLLRLSAGRLHEKNN